MKSVLGRQAYIILPADRRNSDALDLKGQPKDVRAIKGKCEFKRIQNRPYIMVK